MTVHLFFLNVTAVSSFSITSSSSPANKALFDLTREEEKEYFFKTIGRRVVTIALDNKIKIRGRPGPGRPPRRLRDGYVKPDRRI